MIGLLSCFGLIKLGFFTFWFDWIRIFHVSFSFSSLSIECLWSISVCFSIEGEITIVNRQRLTTVIGKGLLYRPLAHCSGFNTHTHTHTSFDIKINFQLNEYIHIKWHEWVIGIIRFRFVWIPQLISPCYWRIFIFPFLTSGMNV